MGEGVGQLILLGIGLWAVFRGRGKPGQSLPGGSVGSIQVSQNPWMMRQIAQGVYQAQSRALRRHS